MSDDKREETQRGYFSDFGDEDVYFIDGSVLKRDKKISKRKERGDIYYSDLRRDKNKKKTRR